MLVPTCKVRILWLLQCALLTAVCYFSFACSSTDSTVQQSTTPRLLLTPFRGKGFGATQQIPILVAAEVAGKIRGRYCLLLQIDHSSTDKMLLQVNKGNVLSETDPDVSEVVFDKYRLCREEKRPCLVGLIDSKKTEFIAQVELLTPGAGGLLVGGLFKGDCTAEDTFDAKNIVAREALALGLQFTPTTTEKTSTTAEPTAETVTNADAGTTE